jgi:hypothetical protein
MSYNLSDCFTLWTPTGLSAEQLNYELARQQEVSEAIQKLLSGQLSLSDAFDIIENQGINMDNYVDEVEENVDELFRSVYLSL